MGEAAAVVVAAQAAAGFLKGFLLCHFFFYMKKVMLSFAGRAFRNIDPARRRRIVEIRMWNLHIADRTVAVAEIPVDVVSCHLSCGYGPDGGGRTCR